MPEVWSTVGYGETGLVTVLRSLSADSSIPGATPGLDERTVTAPRSFCVHPRLCATPISSGDLSLTAISSNERYHSMMPTLSPLWSRFYDRFRSRPFPLDTGATLLQPSSVCLRLIPFAPLFTMSVA